MLWRWLAAMAVSCFTWAAAAAPVCPPVTVTLRGWFDLPRADDRSHGISGLVWDADAGRLLAVSDLSPPILSLVPDASFSHFGFGDGIPVHVDQAWDVEAIALVGSRIFLGNEAGPRVHIFDRRGAALGELRLPRSFRRARHNQGLESLTASPDGKVLFVANENAFVGDGGIGDPERGTLIRLNRIELDGGRTREYRYRTDPVFSAAPDGRVGVSDMAALSTTRILVVERAYVPRDGNSVRLYCVELPRAPAGVLAKTLVVDIASLPDAGVTEPDQPQRNRLLDNFEGLAVGPRLPAGKRLLFLVSDDNAAKRQVPRILVLEAEE